MVEAALQRAWTRRGALSLLLRPASWLYGGAVGLRSFLYRRGHLRTHRLPAPVVVVGNVLAGGAGKTPVVMAIVEHLKAAGIDCGVVSRGYGRQARDCQEVTPRSSAAEVGDEPLLVARRCGVPVFVAARRVEAARALLARHPRVRLLVSDDGLQHLALARDIEVCVFDQRGTGNGLLLPAGPLREPWPREADLVLRPPGVAIPGFGIERRLAAFAIRADGSRRALAELARLPNLVALAGIARPQAFFDMLRLQGLPLQQAIALPDHHDMDWGALPVPAGATLLCTEKDAVKLWRQRPQAWAVPLEVRIEAGFWERLDRLVEAKLSSRDGFQTA